MTNDYYIRDASDTDAVYYFWRSTVCAVARQMRYRLRTSVEARARIVEETDDNVDDIEEPNVYPYKKCSVCSERSSCGNYNDNKEWVCESCAADADEEDNDNGVACKRCGDTTCEEDSHYNCRLLWNSNKTGKQICRRCVGEEDEGGGDHATEDCPGVVEEEDGKHCENCDNELEENEGRITEDKDALLLCWSCYEKQEECPGDEDDYDFHECCDSGCRYTGHWYKKEATQN